jgi:anti-sigma factor RsiW
MDACPEERLSAYLDGELPEAEARAIEAHLASCERCAADLEALRQLEELTRGLAAPPVDEAEWSARWEGVAARVHRRAPAARASRLRRVVRLALVPAAAAALIALAVGLWAVGPYNEAEADECVVEYVEAADGYSSSYYHSDDAGVTIITLVPAASEEASPSDASGDPD